MHEFLQRAREALSVRQPATAVDFYLRGLSETNPNHRSIYENELVYALEMWGDDCDPQVYSSALLKACFLLPGNLFIASMCGRFFASTGYYHQALYFYSEAKGSTDRETRILATTCVENIKFSIIPNWHWSMVNDEWRNFAFDNALKLAHQNKPNGRVLDVGTGTGILSAFAKRYFPAVFSCELVSCMCEIARHVIGQPIIQKPSYSVTLDDLGGEKVDVLVTETIDSDVVGEGIVDIVYDAYNRLLNDNAIIIPYGIIVYGCLVESQAIADISHLTIGSQQFIASFAMPSYLYREVKETEPVDYYCRDLYSLKGGYRILSKSDLFRINFNNYEEIQRIVNVGFTKIIAAQVLHDGTAHAIVTWFRCVVYPDSEPIITGPGSRSCWEQAIYPLPVPVPVKAGDRCGLMSRVKKCAVLNSFIGVNSSIPNKLAPETILLNETYAKRTFLEYLTPLDAVEFLLNNDCSLLQFFEAALEAERSHLRNYILDIAMIPKMTYQLAQKFGTHVIYSAQKEHDKLIKAFANIDNCHLVAHDLLNEVMDSKKSSTFDIKKVDALLCWPINTSGCLNDGMVDTLCRLRLRFASLDHKVIVIPSRIIIKAQLIHSPELKHKLKMNKSAYRGVNMNVLNSYRRQHFFDVEVSRTNYEELSEPFDLMPIKLDEELDLDSQVLPQLINYSIRSESVSTKAGILDGLLYWFEAGHMDQSYSNKSSGGNNRCAFYSFKGTRRISVGEHLKFISTLYHSVLTIEELLDEDSDGIF